MPAPTAAARKPTDGPASSHAREKLGCAVLSRAASTHDPAISAGITRKGTTATASRPTPTHATANARFPACGIAIPQFRRSTDDTRSSSSQEWYVRSVSKGPGANVPSSWETPDSQFHLRVPSRA